MDFDREKVIAAFVTESEENLQAMEQSLVAAEASPNDAELLNGIFRVAHTIKGNASALEFPELSGFAHVLEDLLDSVRQRQITITPQLISLILNAVDALRTLVPAAAQGNDRLSPSHQDLKQKIANYGTARQFDREAQAQEQGPSPKEVSGSVNGTRNRTLRVDTAKLDTMLNLTGEIAIAQGRQRRMIEQLGSEAGRELLEMHRETERLYKELQEQVMSVRMVPVGPLFQQLVRAVRDISRSHNKLARLEIVGAEVEVDTRVLEQLKDPLLHMIRNAVDHGIETPEERHRKGKNPCGILTLKAFHSAGNIMIQLSDDGAGFNRKRILAKAVTMGLVKEGEQLPDQEVYRFVFSAGFSTAESVTDLSGRGVGMDVVQRNIDSLRGNIDVQSSEDEGATITIRLPLTLAIIEAFAVVVDGETYVIPLETISECLDLPEEQITGTSGGIISLRGEPLPYVRLRDALGIGGRAGQRENIVVLQHEGGLAGLAVDELLGESQAIIKPLSSLFRQVRAVSGSTILGDGRVALILDVATLMRDAIAEQVQALN
ncbi:MAG TPA: chemotaxis protein CheA [Terriglobales bacterium]|nr:chemotaxis protein CheA [Terriglobales bacterium]